MPNGYEPMVVGGVAPSSSGNAVVLVDHPRRRGLLIFVGGTEALSLHLRLRQEHYSRPLTHDLLDKVMKELGGNIVSAQVDKLETEFSTARCVSTEAQRVSSASTHARVTRWRLQWAAPPPCS